MNVRDMHIEVQQSVQQVAANRSRKFLPEEIDWVLNKMMGRYIQSRLRPKTDANGRPTGGFELDQLQADSIRSLLVTGKTLVPYAFDDRRYKCFLPSDYQYLISDWSYTTNLCGKTPEVGSSTLFITRLLQEKTTKGSAPFYENISVFLAGTNVAVPADLPYGNAHLGYPEKEDISFLVPWITWKSGLYWERFDDLYYPSHYLKVDTVAPAGSVSTVIDGAAGTDVTGTITRPLKIHPGAGVHVDNRLSPSEVIASMNQARYFRTSFYSPISELAGNTLWVYRDNSFTVNSVQVTYVRKPQPISLSLNTDCEIAPEFHQTICDLAVEYLKGRVENDKGTVLAKTDLAERVIL
jgi:hypothetical protein